MRVQAADMIAYCVREALRGIDPPDPLVSKVIDILGTHGTTTNLFPWKEGGGGLGSGEIEKSVTS